MERGASGSTPTLTGKNCGDLLGFAKFEMQCTEHFLSRSRLFNTTQAKVMFVISNLGGEGGTQPNRRFP